MSPSSFPSKVISPVNFSVPLSSTSELRTFLELLFDGVFIFGLDSFCFSLFTPAAMPLSTLNLLNCELFEFCYPVPYENAPGSVLRRSCFSKLCGGKSGHWWNQSADCRSAREEFACARR